MIPGKSDAYLWGVNILLSQGEVWVPKSGPFTVSETTKNRTHAVARKSRYLYLDERRWTVYRYV